MHSLQQHRRASFRYVQTEEPNSLLNKKCGWGSFCWVAAQLLRLQFAKQFVAICEAAIVVHDRGESSTDDAVAAGLRAALVVEGELPVGDLDTNNDDDDDAEFDVDVDEIAVATAATTTASAAANGDGDDDDDADADADDATKLRRRHAALCRFAAFVYDRLLAKQR